MPRGGARPGSGRKPKEKAPRPPVPAIYREAREHARAQFMGRERRPPGQLTPREVLQENMEFYHEQAGEVLATIMQLPTMTRDEQQDAQFAALLLMADHFRMRDKANECAAYLMRYVHRPMGPIPFKEGDEKPAEEQAAQIAAKTIDVIPVHPAADAAFRRAAQGLAPEPRKTL